MSSSNSELELIERARDGDAEAFCSLASAYERRVLLLALYYTRNTADAEDLAQELWLKAFKALGDFRGEASFYTWLRQIMINSFLNHRRGAGSRILFLSEEGETGSGAGGVRAFEPEESLHKKILIQRVFSALEDLTPQQRLIFLLKHHEGMTYEEIAASLGCSAGSVKKSLFRVVAKLRQRLGVSEQEANNDSNGFVPCAAGENF